MSKCQQCERGPRVGNNVSHSVQRTKRRYKINLVKNEGSVICTRCLRTEAKIRV